jgi:hypothetical protein
MLTYSENIFLLREAFRHVMENHPVAIHAFLLLQDYLVGFFRDFYGLKDYSKKPLSSLK